MYQTYPVGLPRWTPRNSEMSSQAQSVPSPNTFPDSIVFEILLSDNRGNETLLTLQNGDLIATAISGPNAGKYVNLTYGRWTS